MEALTFWLFAAAAVVSSIVVVAHRNPVYSTLSLVVTLFSTAVLFVLLGAPFVAVLVVLVYAGAILVLFLFVLMLLNVGRQAPQGGGTVQRVVATVAALAFGGLLAVLLAQDSWAGTTGPLPEELIAVRPLAQMLFSRYLLPFEIVGLLLLAAVIGATALARKAGAEDRL